MSNRTKVKVIFLGDSGVGKSSIILKQEQPSLDLQPSVTIGLHFVNSTVQIASELVEFQIWDTAGMERFQSLTPNSIRNAKFAFLVYDVTNIMDRIADPPEIIILANKTDLTGARQVTEQEGLELATELKCKFFETSAKTDVGINVSFVYVAEQILLKKNKIDNKQPLILEVEDTKKKKKCCRK